MANVKIARQIKDKKGQGFGGLAKQQFKFLMWYIQVPSGHTNTVSITNFPLRVLFVCFLCCWCYLTIVIAFLYSGVCYLITYAMFLGQYWLLLHVKYVLQALINSLRDIAQVYPNRNYAMILATTEIYRSILNVTYFMFSNFLCCIKITITSNLN